MFQVSIMQIASEKMVFIFDLIKLHKEVPDILDDCLSCILLSPRILKLGMKILNSFDFEYIGKPNFWWSRLIPNFCNMIILTWMRMLLLVGYDK